MDDIEKKLNRGRLGGGWDDGDDGRRAAEAFARDAKARRGELKDKVDLEEIKSYCRAFPAGSRCIGQSSALAAGLPIWVTKCASRGVARNSRSDHRDPHAAPLIADFN